MKTTTMDLKRKKTKPKLERPKKQYALDQCALYKIKGLKQLCAVLNWQKGPSSLERFADKPNNYRVWRENGRLIQAPIDELRKIQFRIATLLRRVQPPEYRHSGIRERSFLTNAQQHLADDPALKIDIRRFYPSTTFAYVHRFFKEEMKCAGDVSIILAKICCYRSSLRGTAHLPTGGVHSEVLGFYCHKRNFDALLSRTEARGGAMSTYVDDIMVTMPSAGITDLEWARRLFKQSGIEMHRGKSQVIAKRASKKITGVVIRDGKTRATAAQHKKVQELEKRLKNTTDLKERKRIARSLVGHLDHIAQVDEDYKSRAKGTRGRLASLLKP